MYWTPGLPALKTWGALVLGASRRCEFGLTCSGGGALQRGSEVLPACCIAGGSCLHSCNNPVVFEAE